MDFGLILCWHVCTTVLGCLYAMASFSISSCVSSVYVLLDRALCVLIYVCLGVFVALCTSVRAPKSRQTWVPALALAARPLTS